MSFKDNIKNNFWPLVTIACFFVAALYAILHDEFKLYEREKKFEETIRIGLFKEGDDQPFKELGEKILDSIPNKANVKVTLKTISEFKEACRLFQEKKLDILGEVTPNVYIDKSSECNFEPFIGIEYQWSPYYRSVLFSSSHGKMCGIKYSKDHDANNLGEALTKLKASSNNDCKVAYVKDEDSASRYYYPISYLMEESVSTEAMQPLTNDETVFKSIFENGVGDMKPDKYVAGFLPDYRYNRYITKFNKEDEAIVLDTTDPIPNGLFVARKGVFNELNEDTKSRILNVWKGIRNVGETGSLITGWRTGQSLSRDLELVSYHKLKVDNKDKLQGSYKEITSVVFVFILTLILLFTTVLLGRKK